MCIRIGFGGPSPPKLANLLKSLSKNQWKPAILDNFNGNFAIFSKIFKFYLNFRENLDKTVGNFETIHF